MPAKSQATGKGRKPGTIRWRHSGQAPDTYVAEHGGLTAYVWEWSLGPPRGYRVQITGTRNRLVTLRSPRLLADAKAVAEARLRAAEDRRRALLRELKGALKR
jgi:hypothetical protein